LLLPDGEFLQCGFDGLDKVIRGGGAGGEADSVFGLKPVWIEIRGGLDVVDARAVAGAGLHEFAGVVAVGAADDDDDVATGGEFLGGDLALLGGLADGVDETDFGIWKAGAKAGDEFANAGDGLGGLRGDAKAGMVRKAIDIGFGLDKVEGCEVFGKASDLNVAAFADDDGMVSVRDQAQDGSMRESDERAGAFKDFEAMFARMGNGALGSAVGCDHCDGRLDASGIGFEADALPSEVVENGLVVDEFAEDGEWLLFRLGLSESDGVANAEAHTEMICFEDLHSE
jgi:hypothetical protein